jgi:hypothetical protein
MCSKAVVEFGKRVLPDARGMTVLEVGSRIVQAQYDRPLTLRDHICGMRPASYLGVDLFRGEGVDELTSVYELVDRFGENSFDLVVCTEVVEHVKDWRGAFSNLKRVTRGLLLITTRSKGFPYHGWPHDYWRYNTHDLQTILTDFETFALERDPSADGVFYLGRKPADFREADMSRVRLLSPFGNRARLTAPSRPVVGGYAAAQHTYRLLRRLFQ